MEGTYELDILSVNVIISWKLPDQWSFAAKKILLGFSEMFRGEETSLSTLYPVNEIGRKTHCLRK